MKHDEHGTYNMSNAGIDSSYPSFKRFLKRCTHYQLLSAFLDRLLILIQYLHWWISIDGKALSNTVKCVIVDVTIILAAQVTAHVQCIHLLLMKIQCFAIINRFKIEIRISIENTKS